MNAPRSSHRTSPEAFHTPVTAAILGGIFESFLPVISRRLSPSIYNTCRSFESYACCVSHAQSQRMENTESFLQKSTVQGFLTLTSIRYERFATPRRFPQALCHLQPTPSRNSILPGPTPRPLPEIPPRSIHTSTTTSTRAPHRRSPHPPDTGGRLHRRPTPASLDDIQLQHGRKLPP